MVGGAKQVLADSIKYARERRAFGHAIADFGLIQQKVAQMAIRLYAAESVSYRVVGLIESQLTDFSWDQPDAAQRELKAVEEFAAECSYVKIFASEMLDYVADEGVQIHGGYGYHQDYAVERAYRDSRINRIFEGTNEINRMLATGMLLKRAQRGQLPLVEAVKALQEEILSGPSLTAGAGDDATLIANGKKVALMVLGVAYQRFLTDLEQQQEILAGITDIAMNTFAAESCLLRARKCGSELALRMSAVFAREAMELIESTARTLLAACSDGDNLRMNLAVLKRFTKFEPVNAIGLRRSIAARLIEAGRYVIA